MDISDNSVMQHDKAATKAIQRKKRRLAKKYRQHHRDEADKRDRARKACRSQQTTLILCNMVLLASTTMRGLQGYGEEWVGMAGLIAVLSWCVIQTVRLNRDIV